jgi:hypothetical protein
MSEPENGSIENPESLDYALLAIAEGHLEEGRFGLAVVMAQFAFETRVELAFYVLFGIHLPRSEETLWKLLPDRTFMQKGSRMLWTELTGDDICEPRAEWRAYHKHVERRNVLAHGGMLGLRDEPCTRRDAKASVIAVRTLMAHVTRVVRAQTSNTSSLSRGGLHRALSRESEPETPF